MAGILLGLFPVLLMVNTHLAWLDLAVAIAILLAKRSGAARRTARPRPYDDTY